jgi:hypothetical protein
MRPAEGRTISAAAMVPATTKPPSSVPGSRPVTMVTMAPTAVLAITMQTASPPCSEPRQREPGGPLGERRDPLVAAGPPGSARRREPGGVLPASVPGSAGIARVRGPDPGSPPAGTRHGGGGGLTGSRPFPPGPREPGSRPFPPGARCGTPGPSRGVPRPPAGISGPRARTPAPGSPSYGLPGRASRHRGSLICASDVSRCDLVTATRR